MLYRSIPSLLTAPSVTRGKGFLPFSKARRRKSSLVKGGHPDIWSCTVTKLNWNSVFPDDISVPRLEESHKRPIVLDVRRPTSHDSRYL